MFGETARTGYGVTVSLMRGRKTRPKERNDVGVVRDNTKQLKFTPGSTGFSE